MCIRDSLIGGRSMPGHTVQVTPLLGVRNLGREAFDYLVPEGFRDEIAVGSLVAIPFGHRMIDGVVTAVGTAGDVDPARLRPIAAVGSRRVPAELAELAAVMSAHYLAPLGACFQAVVPLHRQASREGKSGRMVSWVAPAAVTVRDGSLTARQTEVLDAVPEAGVAVAELCAQLRVSRAVVAALVNKGALTT